MNYSPLIKELIDNSFNDHIKFSDMEGFDSLKFVRLVLEVEEVIERELEKTEVDCLVDVASLKLVLNQANIQNS